MQAISAQRASNNQSKANSPSHAHPPSIEELLRQVGRQQREIEDLREQVAERDHQVAEREKQLADAAKQVAEREKQLADAARQIAELERQLASRKRNSTNSSKPPSTDGMAGAQRRRCSPRKKSGRKPGGQPGQCALKFLRQHGS